MSSTGGLRAKVELLALPDFLKLLCSRAFSIVGDGVTLAALPFAVLSVTHHASDVGFVLASGSLALVVGLPFGGHLADRFPRRAVMLIGDWTCCLCQGTLAFLIIRREAGLLQMALLYLVYGCGLAVFRPAAGGVVPQLVPASRLQQANALLAVAVSGGNLLGPVIGGTIAAVASPGAAIAVDAGTFGVSALMISLLPKLSKPVTDDTRSVLASLREGWRAVRARDWLFATVIAGGVFQFFFFGGLFVLGPVSLAQSGRGTAAWGVLLTLFGLGNLLGGATGLRWQPARILFAQTLCLLGVAPALVGLGLNAPIPALAALMVVAGASLSIGGLLWETAMQQHLPIEVLARAYAFDELGSTALRPAGQSFAGLAATWVGLSASLVGAGAALVLCLLALLGVRSVRTLRQHTPETTAAQVAGSRT